MTDHPDIYASAEYGQSNPARMLTVHTDYLVHGKAAGYTWPGELCAPAVFDCSAARQMVCH